MATIIDQEKPQADAGFIGKREVAARLCKTERTVEAWMRGGIIPYIKVGTAKGKGRHTARRAPVLFDWPAVKAHLQAKFGVGGKV